MRFRRDRPRPVVRGAGPMRGTQGLKSPRPTAVRPRTRIGGPGRRTPRIRRASAGLTPIRAAALLILLASAAGIYGVSASSAFVARTLSIDGATWTGEAAVRETVGALEGANLFTLRTAELEQRLATLPAVRSALVSVALPDAIGIRLDERTPLLVWQTGADRWLVDREGMVFAKLGDDPPPEAGDLAVVEDVRPASASLQVGAELDPVELDAALRLGSLTPGDVGSSAPGLRIRLDDTSGFVLHTGDGGWSAVFGFYTPTLRSTELIKGQVRLLRSFLADRESTVSRIILADDRNGTYIPRVSARPSPGSAGPSAGDASPSADASAKPSPTTTP
jgi:cell division septal protein FtsQ